MTTYRTPYDAVKPYTRTIHNRVEGYRRAQDDYAPLLAAAEAVDEWHDLIKQDYPEMYVPFRQLRAAIKQAKEREA